MTKAMFINSYWLTRYSI